MGGSIAGAMKSNMEAMGEKQQAAMATQQMRVMARQIEMQNEMRERMQAVGVARMRDLLYFTGSFAALCAVALPLAAKKRGNPAMLAPLVPISFIVGYQYDMAYGNKFTRIISEADHILLHERQYVAFPGGPLTAQSIDVKASKQFQQ